MGEAQEQRDVYNKPRNYRILWFLYLLCTSNSMAVLWAKHHQLELGMLDPKLFEHLFCHVSPTLPWGVDWKPSRSPCSFWVISVIFPHRKISKTYGYGVGSIPINTIFRGMNIHLPAILMFTRGTRFWHTAISTHSIFSIADTLQTCLKRSNMVKTCRPNTQGTQGTQSQHVAAIPADEAL